MSEHKFLTPKETEFIRYHSVRFKWTTESDTNRLIDDISALRAELKAAQAPLKFAQLERDNRTSAYEVGVKTIGQLREQIYQLTRERDELRLDLTGSTINANRTNGDTIRWLLAGRNEQDAEIARQAQQIAELQKDKALIDGIMSDMRIVAGIGGCDIGGMTRDALNAKGSAPSNDEHAWRDEWRVQFRKAAYAAMLQTAKEQEGVDG